MLRARIAVSFLHAAALAACAWDAPSELSGGPPPTAAPAAPAASQAPADSRARDQQAAWKARFGTSTYRYLIDERHHLVYATCLDETSHAQMQQTIEAQADQQAATLFDAPPDVEVFIAVAKPADARIVIGGSTTTEGMYEHPLRRLVASDIGIVLRHELTHVMHFGHMERLGQPHPLWVQEGLASLYESYDLQADGAIVFLPNLRHNQARQMASSKTYMPFAKLMALGSDDFMAKSQQLYPEVRSIFEYLADTGKLRRWYRRYTETFAADRTGVQALEEATGMTLDKIEGDWRTWVLKRPAVQTAPPAGDRNLGMDVVGATDGVQVRKVERRGPAARAGLRVGDVVTAIDGTAVRSPREFNAAVGAVRADRTTATVRRGQERLEVTLEFPAPNPKARADVTHSSNSADGLWPDIRRNALSRASLQSTFEGL